MNRRKFLAGLIALPVVAAAKTILPTLPERNVIMKGAVTGRFSAESFLSVAEIRKLEGIEPSSTSEFADGGIVPKNAKICVLHSCCFPFITALETEEFKKRIKRARKAIP